MTFSGWFDISVTYVVWNLVWFEALLRLKINLHMSELIPVRCVRKGSRLAQLMGCE